jgi:hypothetical protein
MKFSTILALAAPVALVNAATMGHGSHHARHNEHHGLIKRTPGDVKLHQNRKRFSGTATYYAVGLGACGKHNRPSDYIVALNSAQYGGGYPGPNCFKHITITSGGKSANAIIMDECPTCGYGDLDLSQGLFEHFAPTSKGVFEMQWTFGGGGGGGGGGDDDHDDKPKPPPKKDDDKDKDHNKDDAKKDDNKKDDNKKNDDKKDDDKKDDDKKKDDAKKDDNKKDDDKKDDDKKPTSTSAEPSPTVKAEASKSVTPASVQSGKAGGNIDNMNQAFMRVGAMAVRGHQLSSQ